MNRTRTVAALAAAAIVLSAPPAFARHGEREQRRPERPVRVEGAITAVDADSITIGTDDIPVGEGTRYSSPRRLVRTLADLREGDWVRIESRSGVARKVQLKLIKLEGTATAVTADSLSMDVDDANRQGDAFLGDATTADLAITDGTRIDDDQPPVAGDEVEVQARVSADDATALEAISVEVHDAEAEDDDAPSTTSTTSTTVAP